MRIRDFLCRSVRVFGESHTIGGIATVVAVCYGLLFLLGLVEGLGR